MVLTLNSGKKNIIVKERLILSITYATNFKIGLLKIENK